MEGFYGQYVPYWCLKRAHDMVESGELIFSFGTQDMKLSTILEMRTNPKMVIALERLFNFVETGDYARFSEKLLRFQKDVCCLDFCRSIFPDFRFNAQTCMYQLMELMEAEPGKAELFLNNCSHFTIDNIIKKGVNYTNQIVKPISCINIDRFSSPYFRDLYVHCALGQAWLDKDINSIIVLFNKYPEYVEQMTLKIIRHNVEDQYFFMLVSRELYARFPDFARVVLDDRGSCLESIMVFMILVGKVRTVEDMRNVRVKSALKVTVGRVGAAFMAGNLELFGALICILKQDTVLPLMKKITKVVGREVAEPYYAKYFEVFGVESVLVSPFSIPFSFLIKLDIPWTRKVYRTNILRMLVMKGAKGFEKYHGLIWEAVHDPVEQISNLVYTNRASSENLIGALTSFEWLLFSDKSSIKSYFLLLRAIFKVISSRRIDYFLDRDMDYMGMIYRIEKHFVSKYSEQDWKDVLEMSWENDVIYNSISGQHFELALYLFEKIGKKITQESIHCSPIRNLIVCCMTNNLQGVFISLMNSYLSHPDQMEIVHIYGTIIYKMREMQGECLLRPWIKDKMTAWLQKSEKNARNLIPLTIERCGSSINLTQILEEIKSWDDRIQIRLELDLVIEDKL